MRIKSILLTLVSLLSFSTVALSAAPAYAAFSDNSKSAACQGITDTTGGNCGAGSVSSLNKVISTILNFLSVLAGIFAIVMIIVGGVKFITSGGEAQKVASARSTILYAVVGLVIVALSQLLVRFVLHNATK